MNSPEDTARWSDVEVVARYHERTKHQLQRYANGPETLDWDAQPDPFRRYVGAPQVPLPLLPQAPSTLWSSLGQPQVHARPLDRAGLAALLELSLGLAAWKQAGPDRWAVRMNPSSGNLHPTEGWLIQRGAGDLPDGVLHYAPAEHALELRAALPPLPDGESPRVFVALSSIVWREAWKYGERALRYVLLDSGHAAGALRYAAALMGWQLKPCPVDSARLAHWLGLDRDEDFGRAEREEPELLFELTPPLPRRMTADASRQRQRQTLCAVQTLDTWLTGPVAWQGQANRLDAHPMYRWPVVDEAARASRVPTGALPASALPNAPASSQEALAPEPRPARREPRALPPPAPPVPLAAAAVIRARRSAQRFDARERMPAGMLWNLLQALEPSRLPFDALPSPQQPLVHVLFFPHRCEDWTPGAYLLPRSREGRRLLQRTLPGDLAWEPVRPPLGKPALQPLWRLSAQPGLAGTLRTINCHQALGSDAMVAFSLLGHFSPLSQACQYRALMQEAGLIGQALYLQATALGLAGTGIGCFFDDALHRMIGLPEIPSLQSPVQSLYHFTVGRAVIDQRIATEAPYAHLPAWPQRLADANERNASS